MSSPATGTSPAATAGAALAAAPGVPSTTTDPLSPPAAEAPYCRNCGAPLTGAFCADCGQKGDVHVPSTQELVHEALEGITHSDSRLWVTLKYLVFVPGKLTTEYIAGRRVTYLPPFRLYLVLSVLFFVIASLGTADQVRLYQPEVRSGSPGGGLNQKSPEEICHDLQIDLGPAAQAHLKRACEGIVKDRGKTFLHDVFNLLPKAMFVFLPLIAFFNMLLYWRPRQRYAVHLLFFLHLHAFAFLAFTLASLATHAGDAWPALAPATRVLSAALLLGIPLYVLLALRRVFRRSFGGTFFKALALLLIYFVMLMLTMTAVFLYAAWQL